MIQLSSHAMSSASDAPAASLSWTPLHISHTCDLHATSDASACSGDQPALFFSDEQLRSLQLRPGRFVWLRSSIPDATAASTEWTPCVPALVHVLTERMRLFAVPREQQGGVEASALNVTASASLVAPWSSSHKAPLQIQCSSQCFDAALLPVAEFVVLRPRLLSSSAAAGRTPSICDPPPSFLCSFDFIQLLPSLLAGQVISCGARLRVESLRESHGIEWFDVEEIVQHRSAAASSSSVSGVARSTDGSTSSAAFLLSTQTVLSLLPPEPARSSDASSAGDKQLLPSFPASPEHWMRRVYSRAYGYRHLVEEWVNMVWHCVRQHDEEVVRAAEQIKLALLREQEPPPCSSFAVAPLSSYAPHTFLLHGASGTGKSFLARTVAGTSGLPYFFLQASSLFRREEGASEAALVALFAAARAHQFAGRSCIIVLDELDSLLPKPSVDSNSDSVDDAPGGGGGGALIQTGDAAASRWNMGNGRIEWRLCGVLKELLREVNGLDVPLTSSRSSSPAAAASSSLPPLFVFLTCTSPQALDAAGLRSAPFVDWEIALGSLAPSERVEALLMSTKMFRFAELEKHSSDKDASTDKVAVQQRRAILEGIAAELHGFVGADIDGLVCETLLAAITRCKKEHPSLSAQTSIEPFSPAHVVVRRQDWDGVLEWFNPASMASLEFRLPKLAPSPVKTGESTAVVASDTAAAPVDPMVPLPFSAFASCFSSLAGISPQLRDLHYSFLLPLKQPALFQRWSERLGMAASKGILLYGPSGTGKSSLAVLLARACGLNCMVVPATSLAGKVVGAAEKNLTAIFAKARQAAPSLLVLDQVEMLAPVRQGLIQTEGNGPERGHDPDAYERILSVLLIEMDGAFSSGSGSAPVYVLATSTRPDLVDPALLRPGRLDTHVHLPLPSIGSRREILTLAMEQTPLYVDVDGEGRVIVPKEFSLEWSVMEPDVRARLAQIDWKDGISATTGADAATANAPVSPSPPELKAFFISLLASVTNAFSGADLLALVRESAMCALRRSIHSVVVRSWIDVWQTLRHSRASVGRGAREYHPFGARVAAAECVGWSAGPGAAAAGGAGAFASSATTVASPAAAAGEPPASAAFFKKHRAEEIVARNLAVNAAARVSASGSASAAPALAQHTAVFEFAEFAASLPSLAPPIAPFVFDGGDSASSSAAVTSDAPFSFGDGGSDGSSASAPLSFSMGSADAPPPSHAQEKRDGAAAGAPRHSVKSPRR